MSYVTLEVEIDHGSVTVKEPEKLPLNAKGLLTIFPEATPMPQGERIEFPLIKGNGRRIIDPTREELDASLWD